MLRARMRWIGPGESTNMCRLRNQRSYAGPTEPPGRAWHVPHKPYRQEAVLASDAWQTTSTRAKGSRGMLDATGAMQEMQQRSVDGLLEQDPRQKLEDPLLRRSECWGGLCDSGGFGTWVPSLRAASRPARCPWQASSECHPSGHTHDGVKAIVPVCRSSLHTVTFLPVLTLIGTAVEVDAGRRATSFDVRGICTDKATTHGARAVQHPRWHCTTPGGEGQPNLRGAMPRALFSNQRRRRKRLTQLERVIWVCS